MRESTPSTAAIYPFVPASSSAIPVEVQCLDSAHVMRRKPAHGHLFYELIVIAGGHGVHRLDGVPLAATARTAFVIPPGTTHDLREIDTAYGWTVLFLADAADPSTPAVLARMPDPAAGALFDVFRRHDGKAPQPIHLDRAAYDEAEHLLHRLQQELHRRPYGYAEAVRAALQLLLMTVARCAPWMQVDVGVPVAPQQPRGDILDAVLADIDAHFADPGGLAETAARLGFSAAYLTTRIRKLTGRTYGEWLIERRMIEARRLLGTTDLGVANVATRTGYAEVESLIRRFRAYHGMTPTAWRQSARNPR